MIPPPMPDARERQTAKGSLMVFDHQGPAPLREARAGKGQRPMLTTPPEAPRGIRARVRSALAQIRGTLAGLPRVMRLVWGASRPLTLVLAIAAVLAGFIPAAQAYAAKLLTNAVVEAILMHTRHAPDRLALHIPLLWGAIDLPVLSA